MRFTAARAEANRRGAQLRVVSVFAPASMIAGRYAIAFPLPDADVAKNVEQEIRDLIDQNLDDADRPETIEVVALAGTPGQVLVEQS
jgi:nucleotide-binding universal stress UspA family protein